jgi:hypothetical protein
MFEFTSNPEMYTSAYNVISENNYWSFLEKYSPPADRGFMYDKNEKCQKIMNLINNSYDGHSASSIACTMRCMQYIAINGYDNFRVKYLTCS